MRGTARGAGEARQCGTAAGSARALLRSARRAEKTERGKAGRALAPRRPASATGEETAAGWAGPPRPWIPHKDPHPHPPTDPPTHSWEIHHSALGGAIVRDAPTDPGDTSSRARMARIGLGPGPLGPGSTRSRSRWGSGGCGRGARSRGPSPRAWTWTSLPLACGTMAWIAGDRGSRALAMRMAAPLRRARGVRTSQTMERRMGSRMLAVSGHTDAGCGGA